MARRVLITGIAGQDGAYLAQILLERGYEVFGGVRDQAVDYPNLLFSGVSEKIKCLPLDLRRLDEIKAAVSSSQPDLVFNLAGISSLGQSETNPNLTRLINQTAPIDLFDAVFEVNPKVRVFQASSALVFSPDAEAPQSEAAERRPDTLYGKAKNAVDKALAQQKNSGRFACSGILFNHESPLRPETFVSQKIVRGLIHLKQGSKERLELGLFDDERDWSHAKDFARGMADLLEGTEAGDFVFASGHSHRVRDWLLCAAECLKMPVEINGEDLSETLLCSQTGRVLANVNPKFVRKDDRRTRRIGDPSRLRSVIGYQPEYSFEGLIEDMVRAGLARS